MDNYIFREVLCPFCKKPYMTQIYDEYDCTVSKDGNRLNGWLDKCPKCEGAIFVVDGSYEGVDFEGCKIISDITIH